MIVHCRQGLLVTQYAEINLDPLPLAVKYIPWQAEWCQMPPRISDTDIDSTKGLSTIWLAVNQLI